MKRVLCFAILLYTVILSSATVGAKSKVCRIGNFEYQYRVQKSGTWITKITPLSKKGIAILKIPQKMGGKNVVKLGRLTSKYDLDDRGGDGEDSNIFGVTINSEYDGKAIPARIQKMVKKIKKIELPSTITSMAITCFVDVQDGKILNIPKGITKNLEIGSGITYTKWKKLVIDKHNKKYKVENSCLLSKNGKKVYGVVQKKKKIFIPEGVETIDAEGNFDGAEIIVIPSSVKKIEKRADTVFQSAFTTNKETTVIVNKNNKHYASSQGSVYSKETGRLVIGCVKKKVLIIPNTVGKIYRSGITGKNQLEKIIVPESVKEIDWSFDFPTIDKMTWVFMETFPPTLSETNLQAGGLKELTIYVRRGYKDIYLSIWRFLNEERIGHNVRIYELPF